MNGASHILVFLGRLHPALVHLPIGALVVAVMLELLSRSPRFRGVNQHTGLIVTFGAGFAAVSALCGWLLSHEGGYEQDLLGWHKWLGFGTALLCCLAALLYRLDLKKAYRGLLGCGFVVVLVTGHLGGSLTHGRDYLTRYGPLQTEAPPAGSSGSSSSSIAPAVSDDAGAFEALVAPMFQHKCVLCHGLEKSKAGLRLDSLASLLKGGEDGPVIVPGKAAESPLLRRLRLPANDEDHMPPRGKPQPTAEEITLLERWVDAGASAETKVRELKIAPSAQAARPQPPLPSPEKR